MASIAIRGKPKEYTRTEALCAFLVNFSFSQDGQVTYPAYALSKYCIPGPGPVPLMTG